MIAEARAISSIPDDLSSAEAAPLLCAGITTYTPSATPASVAEISRIQGIGGLGHLGIQYARQMGFHTVAIGRGATRKSSPKI